MENITVNMENLTKEERKQLLALVEKGNKTKSKVWKPEKGEIYFLATQTGVVHSHTWTDGRIDNDCYNFGNCYRTEKEAEFFIEKRKVEADLKRFAEENNDEEIDWNKHSVPKYIIQYDCFSKQVVIYETQSIKGVDVYFTSEEITKQAIQEIGEERLKKYYFEVED